MCLPPLLGGLLDVAVVGLRHEVNPAVEIPAKATRGSVCGIVIVAGQVERRAEYDDVFLFEEDAHALGIKARVPCFFTNSTTMRCPSASRRVKRKRSGGGRRR